MEITVTMTAEEFESYRAWQRDFKFNENKRLRDVREIRDAANEICSNLLGAVDELAMSTIERPVFDIKDQHKLASAVDGAHGWFA